MIPFRWATSWLLRNKQMLSAALLHAIGRARFQDLARYFHVRCLKFPLALNCGVPYVRFGLFFK